MVDMVFDSVAYDVLRGGALGWTHDNTDAPAFNATLETAYGIFRHAANFDGYIDVHVWRFVPSSFRLLIEDLHALGLSPLREHRFVTGEGPEFYVALSLAGSGPDRARIALATEALRELAAVRLDGPAG